MPAEPAVAVARQPAVAAVAQPGRNGADGQHQFPDAAQPGQHADDGIGTGMGVAVFQQQKGQRVIRVQPVRREELPSMLALHCREAVAPGPVKPQQEADPAAA